VLVGAQYILLRGSSSTLLADMETEQREHCPTIPRALQRSEHSGHLDF
jgi:hypothetical protein